ncbi:NAD(+) synthase [Candidatus Falkowbacteria bacterium RIFOXYB2_FULL_47_14]|uniref:NH(3)-dependent NAD(+) synthetase n=1 Tax=Candidatus Falkowbacteria bacterium RIFOXYA2_FULL_47_19 TaxID=1797994 RepID=A0A1F5SEK5_9BACT|nr:MAG: NAD(+) synthase [Candidatus Falkowbacteria bacterium RIFOXYA2_FULL_47_19]OGF35225.1 MAG: NAD(+) synthase [Candidatus Falkowbacteria bacterium RIFOXYC2_FULL_46_15]OGF43865.1 MAG: NAD(+) synthase [Candidatus Falkowbacteria bacterium RIFOXYB2_FULL_47_14]
MFKAPISKIVQKLESRALELGSCCSKVFVAGSGGVDSSVIAAILVRAFGPDNTAVLYRDVRSDPKHRNDIRALRDALGFKLIEIDGNPIYDEFLRQCFSQFAAAGLPWHDENTPDAAAAGWDNAYASLKSRLTTPMAGFIAKAIDNGGGRIFGTGNMEEDDLLRYFDKFGDGAVDNNILNGLTKSEVRQIAVYLAGEMSAPILERIANKLPSADLLARGDAHNDENELTGWAQREGFNIALSYGTASTEGNIAWALKANLAEGVITGKKKDWPRERMMAELGFDREQAELIAFLRLIEEKTRHKVEPAPGLSRDILRAEGLVD